MKGILIAFALLLLPVMALGYDDCPYGLVNDTYPGSCGQYVDTDGDGICDHSQAAPEERESNVMLQGGITDGGTGGVISLPGTGGKKAMGTDYNLLPISLALVVLYSASFILSRKKILSTVTHRMLWNVVLLSTFLVSAFLGLLLVIRINFGNVFSLPFDMLFWHVEAGIAMSAVSVFHIIWHWRYFVSIFKKGKK